MPAPAPFCLSSRHLSCTLCEQHCPVQRPLNSSTVQPDVQENLPDCWQCGLCAAVCPVRALPAGSDNNALLVWAEQAAPHPLHLLCPHAQAQEAGAVRLRHCPAVLYAEVLLAIRAMGVTSLQIRCGDCAACPLVGATGDRGADRLLDVMAIAMETLLPQWLRIVHVSAKERVAPVAATKIGAAHIRVYPVDTKPVSRRAFFRVLQGRDSGNSPWRLASNLSLVQTGGPLPAAQGILGRVMALKALCVLLAQGVLQAEQLLPRSLMPCFAVRIRQECTGCGLCAKICPTGALQVTETVQEAQNMLSIACESGLCSGCGQCRDLCRKAAIDVNEGERVTVGQCLAPARLLWSRPVWHCTRCHSPFTTPGSLCPVCSGRLGM